MGSTATSSEGLATSRPSAAASTEMAGVITQSPRNIAAPSIPRTLAATTTRPPAEVLRSSPTSASRPPSPSLSVRSRSPTYSTVTTSINVQIASEVRPYTVSASTASPSARIARIAYSGLVPMSPNTTPTAPTTMTAPREGDRNGMDAGTPARAGHRGRIRPTRSGTRRANPKGAQTS